jgi:hypothetical protein
MRSPTEPCEGSDLGGQSCSGLGFYGEGTGLKCASDCTFDTSGCSGKCGDGVVNGQEECDGAPPTGKTCLDYSYDSGFLGCSPNCAVSLASCQKVGWQRTGPKGISSIWGSSSHDVYAVGGATIDHWDGATWSPVDLPPVSGLGWAGVWGSGPNDVFVVAGGYKTDVGTPVAHWDGAKWSAVSIGDPSSKPLLDGIWGTGPGDVYAYGFVGNDSPIIYRWDGVRWSQISNPTNDSSPKNVVAEMAGSGPNDLYAVMESGFWHWNGSAWEKLDVLGDQIRHVWSAASDDVYAVGALANYRWDGTSWSGLQAVHGSFVWGTGRNDVFVLDDGIFTGEPAALMHWDGAAWTQIYQGATECIWSDGRGSTFLSDLGGILQLSRGLWSDAGFSAGALWGTNDSLYGVGSTGHASFSFGVVPLDRSQSFKALIPPSIDSVDSFWGAADDDLWVTGYPLGATAGTHDLYGIWHWDGSSWKQSASVMLTDPNFPPYPMALGGSGPDDVWAVGNNAMHWNGQVWSSVFTGDGSTAVWASTPTDVFAIGSFLAPGGTQTTGPLVGNIGHWDGTNWIAMNINSRAILTDVWGAGHDVFATGMNMDETNVILRLQGGTNWVPMNVATGGAPPSTFRHIRASGSGNVFATDGGLLHLRNGAWERIATPLKSVASLWVTPTSVYVAEEVEPYAGYYSWLASSGKVYRLDLAEVTCHSPERNCHDGWDNDCDGLQDADDPDCANDKGVEQCANLVDDDGDGMIDCADPDCAKFPGCGKK